MPIFRSALLCTILLGACTPTGLGAGDTPGSRPDMERHDMMPLDLARPDLAQPDFGEPDFGFYCSGSADCGPDEVCCLGGSPEYRCTTVSDCRGHDGLIACDSQSDCQAALGGGACCTGGGLDHCCEY